MLRWHNSRKGSICQREYAIDILSNVGMLGTLGYKLVDALTDINFKVLPNEGELCEPEALEDT